MSPSPIGKLRLVRRTDFNGSWRKDITPGALTIESWGQGFMVGALIIMACTTVANMRTGILLHKLILLEVRYALAGAQFLRCSGSAC